MVHETYDQLGIAANRIARHLRSLGYSAQAGHPLGGLAVYPPLAQAFFFDTVESDDRLAFRLRGREPLKRHPSHTPESSSTHRSSSGQEPEVRASS